jgi:hypothetical protein
MARISKLRTLHPVRQKTIELGMYTICDFCEHSKFVDVIDTGGGVQFDRCLLDERKSLVHDCSQFVIDKELLELDQEERQFYEKKSLCRS